MSHAPRKKACQDPVCAEPARPARATPATREEVERLREKVSRLVTEKPEKAAIILTDWVRKTKPQKKAG